MRGRVSKFTVLTAHQRPREAEMEIKGRSITIEGEKITRLRVYDDRDEAEQAARDEAR